MPPTSHARSSVKKRPVGTRKGPEDKKARNRGYQRSFRERRTAEILSLQTEVKALEGSLETVLVALTTFCDTLTERNIFQTLPTVVQPLQRTLVAAFQSVDGNRLRPQEVTHGQEYVSLPSFRISKSLPTDNSQTKIISFAPTDVFSQEISLAPSTELPAPINYAFLEKSFSRNLYRSCFYYTLQILGTSESPGPPPAAAATALRLSMRFVSIDSSRREASRKCFGPPGIGFDSLDVPFLNIGGSGTHYPRLDMIGQPHMDEQAWVAYAKANGGSAHDIPQRMLDRMLAETSCEGQWFDTNDVEQYLRCKRINLSNDPSTVSVTYGRKSHTLDVSRFVSSLTHNAICLGRCPGIRKAQIHQSFVKSLLPSFI